MFLSCFLYLIACLLVFDYVRSVCCVVVLVRFCSTGALFKLADASMMVAIIVLIVMAVMAIDGRGYACVVWVVFTIAWWLVAIGCPLGNGSSRGNTDGWGGTSAVMDDNYKRSIITTISIIECKR